MGPNNADICLPPGFIPALTVTDPQGQAHSIWADEMGTQWLTQIVRSAEKTDPVLRQLIPILKTAAFFPTPTQPQQEQMNATLKSILTLCSQLQETPNDSPSSH